MRCVSFSHTFLMLYWHLLQSHPCEGSKHFAPSDTSDRPALRCCVDAVMPASAEREKFFSARDFEENCSPHTFTALCVIFFTITLLVSCSCGSLSVLCRSCCLRCSKVIAALSDHECEVVKNIHCNRCLKNRKSCDSVCETSMKHRV